MGARSATTTRPRSTGGTAPPTRWVTYLQRSPSDDSPTNTFTVSGHHDYNTTNGSYTITVTLHHEGAVPDITVTDKVTVVSLLNHSQGYGDPNSLVIGAALSGSFNSRCAVGQANGGPDGFRPGLD